MKASPACARDRCLRECKMSTLAKPKLQIGNVSLTLLCPKTQIPCHLGALTGSREEETRNLFCKSGFLCSCFPKVHQPEHQMQSKWRPKKSIIWAGSKAYSIPFGDFPPMATATLDHMNEAKQKHASNFENHDVRVCSRWARLIVRLI